MILGILQARVSSFRLPGKVLKPVLGKPMLFRQIERVLRCRRMDRLLVASSVDPSDDPIGMLCAENGIPCFRGELNDVLDRFYQGAKPYRPEHVVRLTGDCPLLDPLLIDRLIGFHLAGDYDYTSNALEHTFPNGLDSEVFRFSCLETAWKEAELPSQREHVTPFLYRHPERFRLGSLRSPVDLSRLRWCVDEPADFELVTKIYEALYPRNPAFTTDDILAFLDRNPVLKSWNIHHLRNEGYQKSLAEDAEFLRKKRR